MSEMSVISPEFTLSSRPPPKAYLIVRVVFDGASPKVFVLRKLLGSKASVRKLGLPGKLEPTLVGFGIISSSGLSDTPAPNLIIVLSFSSINVMSNFLWLTHCPALRGSVVK